MKPIMQTDFTFQTGNCMQACVASIFELELDQVPNFNKHGPKYYDEEIESWCDLINMIALDITLEHGALNLFRDTHIIAIGNSPRSTEGLKHACVYKNGEIVHDPHPDGTLISLPPYCFTVFIIKDPSRYSAVSRTQHELEASFDNWYQT